MRRLRILKFAVYLLTIIASFYYLNPIYVVCGEIADVKKTNLFNFPKLIQLVESSNEIDIAEDIEVAKVLEDVNSNLKVAFLSFDDGPSNYTSEVLDVLEEFNVSAIFFLWGDRILDNLVRSELLLQRMVNGGHQLALHSMNHDFYDLYIGPHAPARFISQMTEVSHIIYDLTGVRSYLCRAPFGKLGTFTPQHHEAVEQSSFRCIDWNIDPEDWRNESAYLIFEQFVRQVRYLGYPPEIMVLLHDVYARTVEALPMIINFLIENGYEIRPYDSNHEFIFQNYRM